MPPETRRAARVAAQAAREPGDDTVEFSRGRRRRRTWLVVAIIAIVLLGSAVWLAFRALTVKNDLEAAQAALASVADGGDMSSAMATVAERSASAAAAAGDPVWRVSELIPWAGDNLRAVRLAAEAVDVIANDIGMPVLDMQGDGEGRILARALPVIESGAATLAPIAQELAEVSDSDALIGPVRGGVDDIKDVLEPVQPVLELLPSLLGADGSKNYLLVFQNNAESLPLGGSAASQTLVNATDGDLQISGQAGSGAFEEKIPLDIAIDESASALYGDTFGRRVNMSTTRPDWPSAAQMLAAFWNRDIDDTKIDGVISIDPIALSRILVATGPITVGDTTLDESNAVKVLLSDVYERWDAYTPAGAVASDAFFAATAVQIFDKIASGDFELKDMAWAIAESVETGSTMAWMADEAVQSTLAGSGRIAGILPTDNHEHTTLGVYFRDVSASKIDYYMESQVDAAMTCDNGTATLSVEATLHLDISQSDADALPAYVKSFRNGSTYFSTQVFMYAPPGMVLTDTSVDGEWVETFREGNVDLGRVVAPFQMRITPDETVTVSAVFTGDGEFGPLTVWNTPMIRDTDLSIADSCTR